MRVILLLLTVCLVAASGAAGERTRDDVRRVELRDGSRAVLVKLAPRRVEVPRAARDVLAIVPAAPIVREPARVLLATTDVIAIACPSVDAVPATARGPPRACRVHA